MLYSKSVFEKKFSVLSCSIFGFTKNHIFVLQWPSLSPHHWHQHLWVGGGAELVGDGFSLGEQERQVFESPDTHLQLGWRSVSASGRPIQVRLADGLKLGHAQPVDVSGKRT